jgi:hypothetical protein
LVGAEKWRAWGCRSCRLLGIRGVAGEEGKIQLVMAWVSWLPGITGQAQTHTERCLVHLGWLVNRTVVPSLRVSNLEQIQGYSDVVILC